MMMFRTVEIAFARFQATRDARALAIVFDRTAKELLRVAHHVAHDPSAAEDLVQATFLTAIEAADSHARGKPVLPWLLGILANHARAARRRERREPDLQRLRGDVIADVHAEVHARDLQRELAAAIARLPEAYRPVLRLWFEHGLEAHEIATALERPAGTVRAQISRGMEALRRLLPASLAGGAAVTVVTGNGLAAVRAKVLANGAATSGLASTLAIGGLLVLNHKLLAAAAALLLAVLFLVATPALDVLPVHRAPEPAGPAPVAATLPSEAHAAAPPPVHDRRGVEVAAPPPTEPAAELPATSGRLVVQLRSADGAPVPGVGVALQRSGDRGVPGALTAYHPTDAKGAIHFGSVETGSWQVDVDRLGVGALVVVKPGQRTERTITLPDAVLVDGTVVDTTGQPAGGAAVVLHASRRAAPQVAVTDAQGRFQVAHVTSGVELQARKPGHAPSPAHLVQGQPGDRVSLTLRLGEGGRRILGNVLDAERQPAAGAAVAVLPAAARRVMPWDRGAPQPRALWLLTDAEGRFATDEVAPAEYIVVACFADSSVAPACAEADTRITDAHVELRSAAASVVEGSVRRSGEAIAGLTIIAFTERADFAIGYLQDLLGMRFGGCEENGAFRIAGVLPGDIVIRAVLGTQVLGESRRTIAIGETTRWDLDVDGGGKLTIRVVGASSLPPRLGAFVQDTGTPSAAPSFVTFDAAGVGELDGPRAGPVDATLVTMPGPNCIVQLARRSDVAANEREIVFELRDEQLPARSLRGRLVDSLGAPASGVIVRAERTDAPPLVVILETAAGADGTFALGPLPAGRYWLNTGNLTARVPLGDAVLTSACDEQLGDLVLRSR